MSGIRKLFGSIPRLNRTIALTKDNKNIIAKIKSTTKHTISVITNGFTI